MRIKAKIANKSAAVPKLYTGGWISVKERLPDEELAEYKGKYPAEEGVEVLVVINGALEPTSLYYDGETFRDFVYHESLPVEFWQPLPKPPMPLKNALNCRCSVYPNNAVLRKNAVMQMLFDKRESKAYQLVAQMEGVILPEKLLQERELVDKQLEDVKVKTEYLLCNDKSRAGYLGELINGLPLLVPKSKAKRFESPIDAAIYAEHFNQLGWDFEVECENNETP